MKARAFLRWRKQQGAGMAGKVESVPDGAAAAAIAAFEMCQKLMLFLIEQGILPAEHALAMLNESVELHRRIMDEAGAYQSERVAHLLEQFAEQIAKHHGPQEA
jgi:hypothetical protein